MRSLPQSREKRADKRRRQYSTRMVKGRDEKLGKKIVAIRSLSPPQAYSFKEVDCILSTNTSRSRSMGKSRAEICCLLRYRHTSRLVQAWEVAYGTWSIFSVWQKNLTVVTCTRMMDVTSTDRWLLYRTGWVGVATGAQARRQGKIINSPTYSTILFPTRDDERNSADDWPK